MKNETSKRSGGQALVDALRIHGVERVFGVPGESYLAALDAFHDVEDAIEFIVCLSRKAAPPTWRKPTAR